MDFTATDTAERGVFQAIFQALDQTSRSVIGPADPRLLVVPIHDDTGGVIGGLWGVTLFRWLEVEMLFVPAAMRAQGIGTTLMATAETEARARGCLGIHVDALSFQAAPFYEKLGFHVFGSLDDCPPGHRRLFFQKRLA